VSTGAERPEGTRRLLFSMALASGITSVPNAAIVLALTTIHHQLDVSVTELEWTVTGYLLSYSALLIGAGRLADIFGRVRLLVAGTIVYMAASVVAALAHSAIVLIVGMIATGAGAAVLTPGSLAIVTEAFRGERRGTAVGVWGAASALFSAVGPAVGGLLTDGPGWRWILWLNVIVGALILIGVRGTAETRDPNADPRVDGIGLLCSVAGLAAIILVLNEAPDTWAWGSPQAIAFLLAGAFLLVGFVVAERRVRAPLLDLGMFRARNLTGAAIVIFVINFPFGAALFFVPSFLQNILADDPLKAGLLLLPASGVLGLAMPLGGRLYERIGPVPPIVAGMISSGIGMGLLAQADTNTTYADVWFPLVLLGAGVGIALTPTNLAALGSQPVSRHGAVGGILATLGGLGGAFGVAISGAVFESIQASDTVSEAADRGIKIGSGTARTLEGLLSGTPSATTALDKFPHGQQGALHEAVRAGYTSAFATAMLISAIIVVVGAALALAILRRRADVGEPAALPPRPNIADPYPGLALRP
jgi:EmrB/QacA subfamily drug resistance transporter